MLKFFSKKAPDAGNLQEFRSTFFDFDQLDALAAERGGAYRSAHPFPHILLENLLDEQRLNEILAVFPGPDADMYWRQLDLEKDEKKVQHRKLGAPREEELPPLLRQLLWEMNSGLFLRFLEKLTGIENLLPDPSLQGGGLHQSLPGAVLAIHADFTEHRKYLLDRRLNVLLYLNQDWKPGYGGHLELWERDCSRCVRRIMPLLGRMVIFNTDADSFHGHPEIIACPEGMTRKSVALYYYTNGRDDKEVARTYQTDWHHTPRDGLPPLE